MIPPMPASRPALRESLPMVAETVCTDCGVKRTGQRAVLEHDGQVGGLTAGERWAVEPLITAVPLKLDAWMVGRRLHHPVELERLQALGGRVARILLVVRVALRGDLVELGRSLLVKVSST